MTKLVDVEVKIHARTEKAVFVSTDGDSDNAVWLPLSQCEVEEHEKLSGIHILTTEEWLATEKGLV